MESNPSPCSNFWTEIEKLRDIFPLKEILNSNIIGEDITPLDLWQNLMYDWKQNDPCSKYSKQEESNTGYKNPKEHDSVPEIFKIEINVKEFIPEEINVRVVDDSVIVEAKHDEKPDESGFVSRQLIRRFPIPGGYNVDLVTSSLTAQGILKVEVPKKYLGGSSVRRIPVIRIGSSEIPSNSNASLN